MAKPIKFTEDELKSIQDLQVNFNQITLAMGQLTISRLGLDSREESLKQALTDASTKENEVAKELTEKYGKGSLNIENGEFTPIPEEVEEITEEKS